MITKRIKLIDLIEAGNFKPPFHISVTFKGKHFTAKIDKDGFVLMNGKRYTSLSMAGGIVRSIVSGKSTDGLLYRRVNGWTFWKFKAKTGEIIPIDILRKQYVQIINTDTRSC